MAIRILICNQKGGVGKTTTTMEICYLMAKKGYRVLAIDLDGQRDLSKYTDENLDEYENKYSIMEVLNADIAIEDAIRHNVGNLGFDIIISNKRLSEPDKIYGSPDDIFLLNEVLKFVDDQYDMIIFDTAPARNQLLYMSYFASNYIIPVSEADIGSTDGIRELGADIYRFKARYGDMVKTKVLGILQTKYDERTNASKKAYKRLEEIAEEYSITHDDMKCTPFETYIRVATLSNDTKDDYKPLNVSSRTNGASTDYRHLVWEIETRIKKDRGVKELK